MICVMPRVGNLRARHLIAYLWADLSPIGRLFVAAVKHLEGPIHAHLVAEH